MYEFVTKYKSLKVRDLKYYKIVEYLMITVI